ncbi:MAG: LUD domain-containing protein, partial [Saprospiraceae bacterium]|nr:LUD domain-containing protein [Saprospiraceae bacterium]
MRHANKAAAFIQNESKTDWHNASIWRAREKRDLAAHGIPEWEQLRELASQVKDNVLSRLDEYLLQFEAAATRNGVQVHWAATAEDHNRIVLDILRKNKLSKVVKSKSMLTEECHLNPYLEANGVEVIDTDLGER